MVMYGGDGLLRPKPQVRSDCGEQDQILIDVPSRLEKSLHGQVVKDCPCNQLVKPFDGQVLVRPPPPHLPDQLLAG